MNLKLVSSSWVVEFQDQFGNTHQVDTGTASKEDAELIVKSAKVSEIESAAKVMHLSGDIITRIVSGKSVKLSDAVDMFVAHALVQYGSMKTARNVVHTVKMWVREARLENAYPSSVTPDVIDAWVNSPASQNKLGTRKFKLSCLKSFFDYLTGNGISPSNPASVVSVKTYPLTQEQKLVQHKLVFSSDELELLISKLSGFQRDAVILSADCGLRLGDVCNLEFCNFTRDGLRLVSAKNGQELTVPFTERVFSVASSRRNGNTTQFLFPEERKVYSCPSRRSTLSSGFSRRFRELGFSGRSFHSLRATYAVQRFGEAKHALMELEATKTVSKLLGHASARVTTDYLGSLTS